mgnify:CR=1 FL=1
MKNLLIPALAAIGSIFGAIGTSACIVVLFDEPEMPESLN